MGAGREGDAQAKRAPLAAAIVPSRDSSNVRARVLPRRLGVQRARTPAGGGARLRERALRRPSVSSPAIYA